MNVVGISLDYRGVHVDEADSEEIVSLVTNEEPLLDVVEAVEEEIFADVVVEKRGRTIG